MCAVNWYNEDKPAQHQNVLFALSHNSRAYSCVCTFEARGAAGEEDSAGEPAPQVDAAFPDGVVHHLVQPVRFDPEEAWLEQELGAAEALVVDRDRAAYRSFITWK